MGDWKTPKRELACQRCEKAFEADEKFFSMLAVEADEIRRADLCRGCFGGNEPEPETIWWRTLHQPDRKRGLALDFEAIERLFEQLEGCAEERLQRLRYVLCLLLLRKRRLKVVRIDRSGGEEAMVVRRPRKTVEMRVVVFDLTPEETESLRGELMALFEGAEDGEPMPDPLPVSGGEPSTAGE